MVKQFTLFLVLSWMVLLAPGCMSGQDMSGCEYVIDRYYTAQEKGDYQSLLSLYHHTAFKDQDRTEFTKHLTAANKKLGIHRKHKLVRTGLKEQVGLNSGTYIMLHYEVEYEHHRAEEVFAVTKTPIGQGGFKIVFHDIKSDALGS